MNSNLKTISDKGIATSLELLLEEIEEVAAEDLPNPDTYDEYLALQQAETGHLVEEVGTLIAQAEGAELITWQSPGGTWLRLYRADDPTLGVKSIWMIRRKQASTGETIG